MSKKYIKKIFLVPARDRVGATRLYAAITAQRCPQAEPSYIKQYCLTGGRVQHLERLLLQHIEAKADQAARATGPEHDLLCRQLTQVTKAAALVACCLEALYGLPLRQASRDLLDVLEKAQGLAQGANHERDLCVHRHDRDRSRSSDYFKPGRRSPFSGW